MDPPPRWDFEAVAALLELARLDVRQARRLLQVIRSYSETRRGDVKKLQGRHGWRLRSGDWRAVFERSPDGFGMLITAIDNRRDAY